MKIDAEVIRTIVKYEPETGLFVWLHRPLRPGVERLDKAWNTRLAGTIAGRPGRHGHIYLNIGYKNYAAHRLAWLYVYGEWPSECIDHANGIPSDNRMSNLRLSSQRENSRNSKRRSDNTSGHKGVSWSKSSRKWYAYINLNGKMKALGLFENLDDAVAVRKASAEALFGEFARED